MAKVQSSGSFWPRWLEKLWVREDVPHAKGADSEDRRTESPIAIPAVKPQPMHDHLLASDLGRQGDENGTVAELPENAWYEAVDPFQTKTAKETAPANRTETLENIRKAILGRPGRSGEIGRLQ